MVECVALTEHMEKALLGDIPGEGAPAVELEVEPIEEDPSETVGSSSSVHLY